MIPARGAIGLLILAAAIAGCAGSSSRVAIPLISPERPSDPAQVVAVLDDVHRGLEQRKVYKVLSHVSTAYRDMEGRDYEGIRDHVSRILKQYRYIRVTRAQPKVTVAGDRAQAVETFGTTAEPANPDAAPAVNLQGQVTVYLQREDGVWKIVEWGAIR